MKALAAAALLVALAFASSSETALFSLNRFQLRRVKERHRGAYGRIRTLLSRPSRLLVLILLMSELANLTFSSLVATSLDHWLTGHTASWSLIMVVSLLVSTSLLLFFGEITPKVVAAKMNRIIAVLNSGTLIVLYRLLFPLLWFFDVVIGFVLRSLKAEGRDHLSKTMSVLGEDDFVLLMEEGHREGTVEPSERKLIKNVFEFDDSTVSEIMTPITEAFCVSDIARIADVLPEIRSQKYSRVPVFHKNRRNFVGILYVKDLLALQSHPESVQADVRSLMTPPMYVGPNMRLSLLFRRFKEAKTHMAVVVKPDEEAVGVITLEDVLESLFGEIADERDVP